MAGTAASLVDRELLIEEQKSTSVVVVVDEPTIPYLEQAKPSCASFSSIRSNPHTQTLAVGGSHGPTVAVSLSRPFLYRGVEDQSTLVVSEQGSIHLRGETGTPDVYDLPHIAVAQQAATEAPHGVLWLDTGSSHIASWESVVHRGLVLNFQVELYDAGDMELRWQPQVVPFAVEAGIVDGDLLHLPVSGCHAGGVCSVFRFECRRLSLVADPTSRV